MSQDKEPRYAYICGVDFDWEGGEALGGNMIYPSVADLKKNCRCHDGCGIYKIKITLEEVIKVGTRGFDSGDVEVAEVKPVTYEDINASEWERELKKQIKD